MGVWGFGWGIVLIFIVLVCLLGCPWYTNALCFALALAGECLFFAWQKINKTPNINKTSSAPSEADVRLRVKVSYAEIR